MLNTRFKAGIFSLCLMLLVFAPVIENFKKKPKDSFPLSYYPMFAKKRSAHYAMYYLVGYDRNGGRHLIPYNYAGTGGFNQVRRQISKSAKKDRGQALLTTVVKRINRKGSKKMKTLTCIDLVKGSYHLEDFFLMQSRSPVKENVMESINLTI